MLIEQAFYNLPEILVGARYPTQGYEGGIVAAFGLAILQELNGRNANNPISHLIAERIYQIDRVRKDQGGRRYIDRPFRDPTNDKPRYLRADLHVSLRDLRIGTQALARYGWRWSNWIEAKFFRDHYENPSGQKSQNGGLLAADLIRLMALPPIEKFAHRGADRDEWHNEPRHTGLHTGRYLLHVYQGPSEHYHAFRRNKQADKPGGTRKWLQTILQNGAGKIDGLDLENEQPTFVNQINKEIGQIQFTCSVTNFVTGPLFDEKSEDAYSCVLTRIDCYKLEMGQDSWTVSLNREGIQSSGGAFQRIRDQVGNFIHLKEKLDEKPPRQEDLNTANLAPAGDGAGEQPAAMADEAARPVEDEDDVG